MMRLLPMGSLFFSKLSTGNLFNPLHCESCIQKFFLYFAPGLKDYLASQVPDVLFTIFLWSFVSISAVIFIRKIAQILSFNRSLNTSIEQGNLCQRRIENQSLSIALQKQKVKIIVSNAVQTPLAAYWRTILMPKNLYRNNLKNREFGKEAPQNFDLEQATIAGRQGASENQNSEAPPCQIPNSSGCFGIAHLQQSP